MAEHTPRFRDNATAAMFPGQNSWEVGMAKDAYHASPRVREIFDAGSDITGKDLAAISFGDQTDQLTGTIVQTALVASELGQFVHKQELGLESDVLIPYSIGDFAALGAAKAINLEDMFGLVALRAHLAEEADANRSGYMAAVLWMEQHHFLETLGEVTRSFGGDLKESLQGLQSLKEVNQRLSDAANPLQAYWSNRNWKFQHGIAGSKEFIEAFQEKLREKGHRVRLVIQGSEVLKKARIVNLEKIKGAFHSPYTEAAVDEFKAALDDVELSQPNIPILGGQGEYLDDPSTFPDYLSSQLVKGVDWRKTMYVALGDNVRNFVNVGPGNVLEGFVELEFDGRTSVINEAFGKVIQVEWLPDDSPPPELELELAA